MMPPFVISRMERKKICEHCGRECVIVFAYFCIDFLNSLLFVGQGLVKLTLC